MTHMNSSLILTEKIENNFLKVLREINSDNEECEECNKRKEKEEIYENYVLVGALGIITGISMLTLALISKILEKQKN